MTDCPVGNPWKRFAWKWAEPIFAGLGLLTAGAVVTAIQAVYTMPGRVYAVEVKQDTLVKNFEQMRNDLNEVSVATWTFVALDCLRMNDSTFVQSKLPCGRAFIISGVRTRPER